MSKFKPFAVPDFVPANNCQGCHSRDTIIMTLAEANDRMRDAADVFTDGVEQITEEARNITRSSGQMTEINEVLTEIIDAYAEKVIELDPAAISFVTDQSNKLTNFIDKLTAEVEDNVIEAQFIHIPDDDGDRALRKLFNKKER